MAKLASIMTRMVARPRLTALTKVVLTASSGHRPSNWARMEFCFHRPFQAMSL
jgi:hypothetical protein